jgi:acyl carrier protein
VDLRSHGLRALDRIAKSWSENIETMTDQIAKIRSILKEHGRLSRDPETLAAEADLYQAGMTSHASVNVMLALEGEFEVEFPDHMLKRNVFNTIASIGAALDELTA